MNQLTIYELDYRLRPLHCGTVWCMSPCLSHFRLSGNWRCPDMITVESRNPFQRKCYCGAADAGCYLERLKEYKRWSRKLERYLKKREAKI